VAYVDGLTRRARFPDGLGYLTTDLTIGETVLALLSSPDTALLDQLTDIEAVGGLRERLAQVADPRSPQGLRHSLMSILLITVCALTAGKNGYTAIGAWARDAPAVLLAAFDVRVDAFTGRHVCPDESTIRSVMARIDPAGLAASGYAYLADIADGRAAVRLDIPDEREARRARTAAAGRVDPATATATATGRGYALDGKRLAGARRPDGSRVMLFSMVAHQTGITIAQREIPSKTSEIVQATHLLAEVDVTAAVLTLDALHTQRSTAEAIVTDHHATYVLTIKANQPHLLAAVAARFTQPDTHFQADHRYATDTDRGHGRIERRDIRTADAHDIDFPHAAQIFQIIRRSKALTATAWDRKEVVFGITALPSTQTGPADLARYIRQHWSVETKSHYVRDVTFREDASQTRTAHAPANLATLRNLVIGVLRHAGHTNIAHARQLHANSYHRVHTLFNL
jgi:predicted transposase YbfD/YdcC